MHVAVWVFQIDLLIDLFLLEDIQSNNHRDSKEMSDLNLLLQVTAAICHQLQILTEKKSIWIFIKK